MATVHFYTGPREWYRPVIVEKEELYCSPWLPNELPGCVRRKPGVYDVANLLATFPAPFNKPDLVTVMLDHHAPAVGLTKVDCPKVLFVGDTHHGIRPIEMRVRAALQAPWDLVVLEFRHAHCHWFAEAGVPNVAFLCCFNIHPHIYAPKREHHYGATFCGQFGSLHPRRKHVLMELLRRGVKIELFTVPQERAAAIYNESAVSLNVALNGDFNLRNLEIAAAGGVLLSDAREQGECTDTLAKFEDRIQRLLSNKAEAYQRAVIDHEIFLRHFAPERQVEKLRAALSGAPTWRDDRMSFTKGSNVWERINRYEEVQEWHRLHVHDAPFTVKTSDPMAALDACDLPRIYNPSFPKLSAFDPPPLSQLSCPPCC